MQIKYLKENISHKGKCIVEQPTLKLVQRLKGKNKKIGCNYNGKLRNAHDTSEVKNRTK